MTIQETISLVTLTWIIRPTDIFVFGLILDAWTCPKFERLKISKLKNKKSQQNSKRINILASDQRDYSTLAVKSK